MEAVLTVALVVVCVIVGLYMLAAGLAHLGLVVFGGPAWFVWRVRTIWRVYSSAKHEYDDDGIKRERISTKKWVGFIYRGPYGEPVFPLDERIGWFGQTVKVCVRKPRLDRPASFCNRRGSPLKRPPKRWRDADPEEHWRLASKSFPRRELGWAWKETPPETIDVEAGER